MQAECVSVDCALDQLTLLMQQCAATLFLQMDVLAMVW
jgi:hypothetical protein